MSRARLPHLEAKGFYEPRPIYVPATGSINQLVAEIVPGSAIIGFDSTQSVYEDDQAGGSTPLVHIYFEGNLHGAVNLNRFAERCQCAHGRGALKYPTMAMAYVRESDLVQVGIWHPEETVVEVIDMIVLAGWCNWTLPVSARELNAAQY